MASASHSPIQAVLFDLDNTLIDRNAGFVRFSRFLYSQQEAMQRTHTEQEAVDLLVGFDNGGYRTRQEMFQDISSTWPSVFSSVEEVISYFEEHFPANLEIAPETRQLLQDLRREQIPTAIVTNGMSRMQRRKVEFTGLVNLVDAVVISEEADAWKPEPEIFRNALSQVNAEAEFTIFVGDNSEADILGAKGLGMTTAWMHLNRQWPHQGQEPDYTLDQVYHVRSIVLA